MIIHAGYDEERKHIIEYTDKEKKRMSDYFRNIEQQHGFDEDKHRGINSFDNDDYLFLCSLVCEANSVYNRMSRNPDTGEFLKGYKAVPYIHTELTNDFELYDKQLNAGVKKVDDIYWLNFNKYKLEKCILFLQLIFDQNQELVTNLGDLQVKYADQTTGIASDSFEREKLVTRNDIIKQALELERIGAKNICENMKQYALSLKEDEKVHMPAVVFINDEEGQQTIDIAYYDSNRKALSLPLKKKIFNTSGFQKWFNRRKELICKVFRESMQFVITHEFAHIANGHCDLRRVDAQYCKRRDIGLCAELNADDSAVRWRMFDLLFHGIDGNPQDQYLIYTRQELKEEWAIRGFSAYFAMSWCYRGEERKWDESTLEAFLNDSRTRHPVYQFRCYSILNRVLCSLENINTTEGSEYLRTSDGASIDRSLVLETRDEIMDMVYSFEKYFDETYNDNRSLKEWLKESGEIENNSIPNDCQKVPFLMPIYLKGASDEMKKIAEPWKDLRERLMENGAYCKLFHKLID